MKTIKYQCQQHSNVMSETQSQDRKFGYNQFDVNGAKCPISHAFGVKEAKNKADNITVAEKLILRYDKICTERYGKDITGSIITENQSREVWGELMNAIYVEKHDYSNELYDLAYDVASELGWLDEIQPPLP